MSENDGERPTGPKGHDFPRGSAGPSFSKAIGSLPPAVVAALDAAAEACLHAGTGLPLSPRLSPSFYGPSVLRALYAQYAEAGALELPEDTVRERFEALYGPLEGPSTDPDPNMPTPTDPSAAALFKLLQKDFPGFSLHWSGEAYSGDVRVARPSIRAYLPANLDKDQDRPTMLFLIAHDDEKSLVRAARERLLDVKSAFGKIGELDELRQASHRASRILHHVEDLRRQGLCTRGEFDVAYTVQQQATAAYWAAVRERMAQGDE